ncbi:MAG: PglZ domain-containing protein [Ardenticatenia bacterium]|nr:PglZ domain-containing protein [Ardenticatenia bacterium]
MIHITVVDASLDIPLSQSVDLTLERPDQYLLGYDRIARAIHDGTDLHVLVRDKNVSRWLALMARRYGQQYVTLEELTLRRQFQKQIGIEIPADVTDAQILAAGLLDLNIPASPGMSFEDYLLEVFFGNFLTLPGGLGLRRVGELIASYEPDQWQSALERPLVKRLYRKRIRETRQQLRQEDRHAELQLLNWIETSPDVLIRNLFALKVLSNYPDDMGKRVLGQVYHDLSKLNLDLRKVPTVIAGNERAIDEIRLHLETLTSNVDASTLNTLLSQVSGYLEIEFDAVLRVLTSGVAAVTSDLVQSIQDRFQPIKVSPRMAQALADLDLLVSQERPCDPNPAWDEQRWIDWATEEYLPYRFWLENTGRLDDDIAELAGVYSDWLCDNFGKLRYHSHFMAWKALLGLKDEMKAHSGPVLVVVVDNLNAKFYPDLQLQMQYQGYYEQRLSYCLSMLPSCTAVSKKCLMTGHYAPFEGTAYKKPVEDAWSTRLDRLVSYLGSIGELRTISKREHDVYFLNYLPLDITLHQSEHHTGISHAQAIRGYLLSLAQDIRAFGRRIGAERDLMVIFVSDHGSTRIPKGTVNVIQGKFYRERAEDEHHRYISVKDEELSRLPKNVQYDCYVLDRQAFELDANYLVARRLYRFLPTDENTYIHGGLTPEETLVPLAVYLPITVSPRPLVLSLVGAPRIYVGTKLDLSIEITNLNNYSCEQVVVEVADPNFEAQPVHLEMLPQLKRLQVRAPARCHRTADASARKLHVRVSYKFLGQRWVDEIDMPVEIVEPAQVKFDLDNL